MHTKCGFNNTTKRTCDSHGDNIIYDTPIDKINYLLKNINDTKFRKSEIDRICMQDKQYSLILLDVLNFSDSAPNHLCKQRNKLFWVNNSCFIDVILVSLFLTDDTFIGDNILKDDSIEANICRSGGDTTIKDEIRNELVKLFIGIRTPNLSERLTTTLLKKAMVKCPANFNNFGDNKMNDSSHFIRFLFDLFPKTHTTTLLEDGERTYKNPPYYIVDSDTLISINKGITIGELLRDNEYGVFDSEFLAVCLERTTGGGEWVGSHVLPTETITLNGNKLSLLSVIVWDDFHYTCYLKCGDVWYYYDCDSDDDLYSFTTVGTYLDMLRDDSYKALKSSITVLYSKNKY